ncbi:MAG: basic secretory protein-like protein [Armatimonadetes bacterium]|nr:basic secretory protein-like protein [Armatimonadota bacterium]
MTFNSLPTALAALLAVAALPCSAQDGQPALSAYADTLAPLQAAPKVEIDVTAAPAAKPWAERAARLAADWFPHVCQLLATDGFRPPKAMKLTFKPKIGAPAYASGSEITIDSEWIAGHPDDFGMVVHEMTHLIQRYPGSRSTPGWLVEGIADYIRWWRYEPEAPRTPVDPDRAKVTDSYRTTAAFLAWATGRYDRGLVRKLDKACRDRSYKPELFEQATGKTLETLWTEYTDGLRRARGR